MTKWKAAPGVAPYARVSPLEGQCSIVVMSEREPGIVVGVETDPLWLPHWTPKVEQLASDAQPLMEFTKDVYFMDHGDLVVGTKDC